MRRTTSSSPAFFSSSLAASRSLSLFFFLPLFFLFSLSPRTASASPRTHADGFYFRVAVGPGYSLGTLDTPAEISDTTGLAISTQLAIGWTLRPGLVLGGATFPMVVPSPSYDAISAGGQHVSATGPFLDYYPSPRRGLHLQGGLLFALGYLDGGDRASHVGAGYGGTLGVGYDVFISDNWSIGAIARATAYRLYGVDDSINLISPAFLVSLVRH